MALAVCARADLAVAAADSLLPLRDTLQRYRRDGPSLLAMPQEFASQTQHRGNAFDAPISSHILHRIVLRLTERYERRVFHVR